MCHPHGLAYAADVSVARTGTTNMDVDSLRVAFEHHRLGLFKAHGFEGPAATNAILEFLGSSEER